MAPLKCQQNLVMLAIVMVLALGGILQSQGEESEEPWVGNNHIGLQQLSPTNYPKKDGTFNVKVEIRSHAPDGHVRFKFSNSNVSSWKGHAMNAGNELNSDPDLTLTIDQQTPQAGITWSAPPAEPGVQLIGAGWDGDAPDPFTVKVKVHDYGAYGTLTAQLYYDGGEPEEPVSLDLPRDDNGNKIADGWQNDGSENYDASADDEEGSGSNNHDGDGFSVFEEYRGFIVRGLHTRDYTPQTGTYDPTAQKDLFVYSNLAEGYGYASNLPADTFKVWLVDWNDMDGAVRRMDSKGTDIPGNSIGQKALKVLKDDITSQDEDYGKTNAAQPAPPGQSPGTPFQVGDIIIYYKKIRKDTPAHNDEVTPDPADADARKKVIGHEIGHGINVDHHVGSGPCIMEGWVNIMDQGTQYADHGDGDHASEFKLR